jgi:diaminopimelate decarboxylase
MAHVKVKGIDCHIGSQITDVAPFRDALANLLELIAAIRAQGINLEVLDLGGGLGITYNDETPPHPRQYAQALTAALKTETLKLVLEPGRVLVGNAGILVTRVLYRKQGQAKAFVITDAAMNDLIRPTLYGAYHDIKPVVEAPDDAVTADVVGPICESGDFLAQDRRLPDVRPGDLLAVMSAGAYGFTMASNYCSRPRPAEVMVKDDRFAVVRRRETYADLIDGESLPDFY